MSYLRINVNDEDKENIQSLLEKLGYEVSDEDNIRNKLNKSTSTISPTLLFGKWKNVRLNPVTFRKQLWRRKNQ